MPVAVFRDQPRADLEPSALDAFRQYAPPTWQVRIRAPASRHLRGCRQRPQTQNAERERAK
jgi:hypothetical protein